MLKILLLSILTLIVLASGAQPHGNLNILYSWFDTDGKGITVDSHQIGQDIGITGNVFFV
jgi:hypothetical protein